MPKPETSWIVPFLADLRDFAEDHGLDEFAGDLEKMIDRHGPVLGTRTRPSAVDLIEADTVALRAQVSSKPH